MDNNKVSLGQIIKRNGLFFSVILLFFVGVTIVLSQIEKGDFIVWFSDNRSLVGDYFFKYFTKVGEEWTYIVIILVAAWLKRYRLSAGVALVGVTVTIVSQLSKRYFDHPRPALFFKDAGIFESLNLVEGVVLHNAHTSYPSGHTMSGFALFTLLALFMHDKRWGAMGMALIAIFIGISRIYLVQHFLEDIYLGGILGVIIGVIWYWGVNNFKKN